MNSGMYSALSGNLAAMRRLDVITNNLANAGTSGFKQDRIVFDSLLAGKKNPPRVPEANTADPVLLGDRLLTDFSQGAVRSTDNALDLAISGDGFFAVSTPDGTAYTRQGNFKLTSDGTLVTAAGLPVQSSGGQPVVINTLNAEENAKVVVDSQGNITINGEAIATLGLYDFPKPYQLTKLAGAMFVPADENSTPQPVSPVTTVAQGALEESNVDAVSSMVQMIEASRYFESCQKVILSYNEMAAKAVNELARV